MANPNPTIVVASLDDSLIKKSINELVQHVNDGAIQMAKSMDDSVQSIMKSIQKLGSAKVGGTTGSGSGTGGAGAASGTSYDNSIKALRDKIALEKENREAMAQGSDELLKQNGLIQSMQEKLKKNLESQADITKQQQQQTKANELENARLALKRRPGDDAVKIRENISEIEGIINRTRNTDILSPSRVEDLKNRVDKLKDSLEKIEKIGKYKPLTPNQVLGMPEKTLDDITRKLQAIRQVSSQLNINTQRGELNRLNAEAQRLTKLQNDILGNNTKLTTSNRSLASAIGYIRNRMVYALTLGATTNFVKQVYEVRGQYELLERSLGVLVNSFENGKKIFQDLNEMALKSPFTLIELGTAAKQLTAYNFEANEVVDVTRRLADISAALGVPMERLTYNLGQIRAQTVLTARDARDFANAGLPIVKTLSDYYTELEGKIVTTGDVYSRMSKKMVSYNDVMAVLYSMTDKGGKFFDFQAKQAETLRVQMANLTLAFNNMLNEIGESHQSTLSMPLKLLRSLLENWKTLSSTLFVVAGSFAAYKVAQMATNALVGVSVRSIQSQVLAEKQLEAVRLRKKAMTTKLTAEEKKLIANANLVNKADYERIMLERNLTASQAMRLIALNKNNVLLQKAAISTGILTKSQVQLAASGRYLDVALKSMAISLKSLWSGLKTFVSGNIYTIAFTLLASAAMEAYMAISNANEAVENIVSGIKEAATESAKSIEGFIETMKSAQVIEKATFGTLSKEEAGKAWKEMREELEKSSLISDTLISQLEQIPNINERIKQGGNIFENLKQAKLIVADIGEEFVKINDSPLGGILGEGLVDDLQDYGDAIKGVTWVIENLGYAQLRASDYGRQQMKNLESAAEEAKEEVDDTFNAFWKFVEKSNVTDPLMIAEMMENLKDKIKQENPKIKGELANLFDIRMDELLAERTNDAYDKNTSLWKIFMQKLKANYSQTFADIGEDINDLQQKAIDENVDYFRESMPLYYEAIKAMVQDASKLKIMIDVTFNKKEFSDLQKTFMERIGPRVALEVYMPKSNEDVLTWASRLRKERKDYLEQEKALRRVGDQNSVREAERLKTSAINIADSLKAMNQPLDEEKSSSKSEKDELGEALKQQISLIKDMQSNYEKLRKAGVGDFEAIELAAKGYEATLERVNLVLSKYGIDKFNANQFAGKNVKELLEFLVKQREILAQNPKVKTSAIEALDVEIQKLQVDAKTYDFKKITDGLNNELSKIDEQYELAVELQANADLGNQLIDAFGLDVSDFPQTIDQFLQAYQNSVKKAISEVKPDANLDDFDILRTDIADLLKDSDKASTLVNDLLKQQENARKTFQKWLSDTINGWDKLLEKYSEYEYKVNRTIEDAAKERQTIVDKFGTQEQKDLAMQLTANIKAAKDATERQRLEDQLKQLVKEVAGSDDAVLNLTVSIDNKETQELANLSFEEFQKSPEWVTATGDLATLSRSALGMLIQELETYKKKAKNLNPQQLKRLNNALRSLYKQQRSQSPFHEIGDALDQAKERAEDFDDAINDVEGQIKTLVEIQEKEGGLTEEQANKLTTLRERWKKLKEEQSEVGKLSATSVVSAINSSIKAAQDAISIFTDMADALGGKGMTAAKQTITDISSVLEKAGQGAAIGAQIGGGKGAAIGAIGGALAGIVTTFADVLSGNRAITKQVEKSERAVMKLENAYKNLSYAVEKASGSAEIAARRASIANKQLQLDELKRQLALEESRKKKNQDEEKQLQLKGEILDLEHEIQDMTEEVVSNLTGSDIKSAAEDFVDTWVEAWRAGETTLDAINDKMDEMILNLIKKAATSAIVEKILTPLYQKIEDYTDGWSESGYGFSDNELIALANLAGQLGIQINDALGVFYGNLENLDIITKNMEAGDKQLSSLQQGIQGVSEQTANALEGYMNGLSQQAYLRNDLLMQIRDALTLTDNDMAMGVQAQILLQLQQSYVLVQSIHSLMGNWTIPDGSGIRVQLL